MKKIILFSLIFLILIYLIFVVLLGFPLVFEFSKPIEQQKLSFKKGDIIQPLKSVDFIDNSAIYIVIAKSDYKDLHPSINKRRVLACFDKELINQFKQEFKF